MLRPQECVLHSGGANGAEFEFGLQAERYGVGEVNYTFEGQGVLRARGVRVLSPGELLQGDVSLAYVSRLLKRTYTDAPRIRKVLQTIWHMVNAAGEVYVVGKVLPDGTVRGGTGWGAEFAKLCNKPLHVFDQEKNRWLAWREEKWAPVEGPGPRIGATRFAGTGTRFLEDNGRLAIRQLFERSFPPPGKV